MKEYLACDDVIDFTHPKVMAMAMKLSDGIEEDKEAIAKACFEFVLNEIAHTGDSQNSIATCTASEVLEHKTGWCFAKSHLLCALLRANTIPCALEYQRLCFNDDGKAPYSLHGLNAIYLEPYGWFRVDARGNKEGIHATFSPRQESLAFLPHLAGEKDYHERHAKPLSNVVTFLSTYSDIDEAIAHLPDEEL